MNGSHKPVTTQIGRLTLEAPAVEGLAFLGRTGWLGVFCACGFLASGRSMAALEHALADHQVSTTCPAEAELQAQEALEA
jgi:hypothetical protein